MPRKKPKKEESTESQYDVFIAFVHEFEFFNEYHSANLNGHPAIGRCYRLIKDPQGYRIHIGRENNDANYDGLFLGPELKATRKDFKFRVEIITPDNYLQLPINNDDAEQVLEWIKSDNKDLWEKIKLEENGDVPVIKNLSDLLNLIQQASKEEDEPAPPLEKVSISHVPVDPNNDIRDRHYDVSERISNSLNLIADTDDEMIFAIADALEYIVAQLENKEGLRLKEVVLEQTLRFKNNRK